MKKSMKQLQFGSVDSELVKRFNKVLMAMIIKEGEPLTRIRGFELMLEAAEEQYLKKDEPV